MAIAVELSFRGPGATLQNYFKAIQKIPATPGGPHPDSACLFHWVTEGPGGHGYRVTDVWQTREDFDRFTRVTIQPISAELGLPGPHQTNFFEVANFLT